MRLGEIVILRPCDLDRSGDVWLYNPARHKTEYLDHDKTVAVGPRAQEVLLKYLARAADDYCFQPRDSEKKRLAQRKADRKTPLSCGNRPGTNCNGIFKAGNTYSVRSYRQAIRRLLSSRVWTTGRPTDCVTPKGLMSAGIMDWMGPRRSSAIVGPKSQKSTLSWLLRKRLRSREKLDKPSNLLDDLH
jgi:hypothetical protein